MIKLLIFILYFDALVISCSSATEQNNVNEKLHPEKSHKSNIVNQTKLHPTLTKNDNTLEGSKVQLLPDEPKSKPALVHQEKTLEKPHPEQNIHTGQNKTADIAKIPPSHGGPSNMKQESDFITTVSMVLISTSLLFMVFVAFKTYRRKSRNARIKKYGIRLARGNIEMTPLPLDNDDDDETIFDLKNLPT